MFSDGSHYEKRGKGEPVCIDDEIPFEIPESWAWCRFEAALVNRDAERIPVSVAEREHREKIYDYYGASGVIDAIDDYLFDKPLLLIGEDGANLLNRSTPIAFIARGKYWVNNHAHVLDGISTEYLEYVALYINSISLAPYVTGSAQPKMNQQKMGTILIPISPENEQIRILKQCTLLIPLVEQYGILEDARERLDAELPDRLRKSILQLAVQGRLVEQDPADEPASALLERIRAERARLVKEKRVRAPKGGESVIWRASDGGYYEKRGEGDLLCIDDEIPFEIPESWEWVRLEAIGDWKAGATPAKGESKYYSNGTIPWLLTGDLTDGLVTVIPSKITEQALRECSVRLNPVGSVLVAMYGATIGKIGVLGIAAATNQACCACILHNEDIREWLVTWLRYQKPYFIKMGEGGAQPNISRQKIVSCLLPMPPISEQKRIVARCNRLLDRIS